MSPLLHRCVYRTACLAIAILSGCAELHDPSLDQGEEGADDVGAIEESQEALTHASDRIPLVTFFNPADGDYFTTTQPEWTCRFFNTCAQHTRYRVVGLAGYVYRPDRPRPAGTVPLNHWWSARRIDNFLTSDPTWGGPVGTYRADNDGYSLFRVEGYIPTTDTVGGLVPLNSFWSATNRDNAAVNSFRVSMPSGYTRTRREGYLLPPLTARAARCVARLPASYVDDPAWIVQGNLYKNTWREPLADNDALRIGAWGYTTINFWGTQKGVAGEGVAASNFPAPGEPTFALIGRVTSGRMWVPGRGSYPANVWFPIGTGGSCLEYDAQGVAPGRLDLAINDPEVGDNSGGPTVQIQHYRQ